jgi:hypothetical protein
MFLPVKLLSWALSKKEKEKRNATSELYYLALIKNNFRNIRAGWVTKEELIQLFLSKCKTKKTALRWIGRLEDKRWIKCVKGKYHVTASWRIIPKDDITSHRLQVVEVEEKHLQSATAFATFCYDAHCQKNIQENWRRRYDRKYRKYGRGDGGNMIPVKVDSTSYSSTVGNELWTKKRGEYSLRLASSKLGITISKANRLQRRSEQLGWSRREQLFNPDFDQLKLKTAYEAHEFVKNCGNEKIHMGRLVRNFEQYRMRETMLVEYTNNFKYRRYSYKEKLDKNSILRPSV